MYIATLSQSVWCPRVPFIFITDGERVSFTAEEVASPRPPEESQEEAEGIVKSTYLLQLSCVSSQL